MLIHQKFTLLYVLCLINKKNFFFMKILIIFFIFIISELIQIEAPILVSLIKNIIKSKMIYLVYILVAK